MDKGLVLSRSAPMQTYSVKLQAFPPREQIEDWLETPMVEWGFDHLEETIKAINPKYCREIKEEGTSRPGLSVSLHVTVEDNTNMEALNWAIVLAEDNTDIRFVRASLIETNVPTRVCYSCETEFLWPPYLDEDRDVYCSVTCISEQADGDFMRYTDPAGNEFVLNEHNREEGE